MKISSVLVVCVGNICRSPLGERMLADACPDLRVESAGLGALVGHEADDVAANVARENGVDMSGHAGRQFGKDLAADFDLILVMEKRHMQDIARDTPELSGKTMLYGQWTQGRDIPDPYRCSREFHQLVFEMVRAACDGWATKLTGKPHV